VLRPKPAAELKLSACGMLLPCAPEESKTNALSPTAQAAPNGRTALIEKGRRVRADIDDAHLTPQHIEQLRQVVNAGIAEIWTHSRHPGGRGQASLTPSTACTAVRKLSTSKRRPSLPIRCLRWRIGPELSHLMAMATMPMRGKVKRISAQAATKSPRRTAMARCRIGSGRGSCCRFLTRPFIFVNNVRRLLRNLSEYI
jgi:hypothetical protein